MTKLLDLHDRIFAMISAAAGSWFLPTLARFAFAAVLLKYFWGSAATKLGDGVGGLFNLDPNGYVQIFPKKMEMLGYDPSGLNIIYKLIAVLGTWSEFILPALILVGLFTRLAALGMFGFVIVQTFVDVTAHGAKLGSWFNNSSAELIADQRLLWFVLFATLVVKGAGPLSLDRLMKRA
jgi:putative oxidoreductase